MQSPDRAIVRPRHFQPRHRPTEPSFDGSIARPSLAPPRPLGPGNPSNLDNLGNSGNEGVEGR